MDSSSSESDIDQYESAEESLDENEKKTVVKTQKNKCASKISVPVASAKGKKSEGIAETNKSLAYRKRPERVKRSVSKSPPKIKPTVKKPAQNESLFKTDKIAPDAFFQDITSNISKNINKSINSLQQTSSNVKELLLSSLPAVTDIEKEQFTYDEKIPVSLVEKPVKSSKSEALVGNNSESEKYESAPFRSNVEMKNDDIDQDTGIALSPGRKLNITSNRERSRSRSTSRSRERNSSKVPVLKEKKGSDCGGIKTHSNVMEEKGITEGAVSDSTNDGKMVSVEKQKETKGCKKDSSEVTVENKVKQSKSAKYDKSKPCGSSNKSENFKNVEFVSEGENKEVMLVDTSCQVSETQIRRTSEREDIETDEVLPALNKVFVKLPPLKPLKENKNFKEKSQEKLFISAEKLESQPRDFDVQELTLALKTLVADDEETIETPENVTQLEYSSKQNNQPEEIDLLIEEEKKETSKDGWDDFDFSDSEINNQEIKLAEQKVGEITEAKVISKSLLKRMNPKDLGIKGTSLSKKKTSRKDNGINLAENLVLKGDKIFHSPSELDTFKQEMAEKKRLKESQRTEKDFSVANDWNWDAWEDAQEDEDEIGVNAVKEKNYNVNAKESPGGSDETKWKGWDTFGESEDQNQGAWGVGSWGNLLLQKASAVTQGISSALEAGLGAPNPEVLARMEIEKERAQSDNKELTSKELQKNQDSNLFPAFGLGNLVAGVTSKIVEHSKIQEIGSKVITGSLDTLETFGKKTMEVLQEGDPGLRNKRALLLGKSKPGLSQVLREAREKADREMSKVKEKEMAKKCQFETLFDDFNGMVHLEALEMLSRQCELKLEQIRAGMNPEEQEDLNGILKEVEQLCSLDDDEINMSSIVDFKLSLSKAVEPLKNEISVQQIIEVQEKVEKWLATSSKLNPSLNTLHQKVVGTIAELTAATVNQFHKAGEMLAVKDCRKTVEEVDALLSMTTMLCIEINVLCKKFSKLFRECDKDDQDSIESVVEKVELVMKNSTSYIRQAFNLLIPVVQVGAAI